MIVENLFKNEIFPNLKDYIEKNSIYNAIITTKKEKIYPLIFVKLLPIKNEYNNLNYGEESYIFGIDIQIMAKDQENILKEDIGNAITSSVIDYFKANFRMTIRIELDNSNDIEIYQNNVKVTGKLDTRYGLDKLVIYPYEDYQE